MVQNTGQEHRELQTCIIQLRQDPTTTTTTTNNNNNNNYGSSTLIISKPPYDTNLDQFNPPFIPLSASLRSTRSSTVLPVFQVAIFEHISNIKYYETHALLVHYITDF